jgi:hypothetical protein
MYAICRVRWLVPVALASVICCGCLPTGAGPTSTDPDPPGPVTGTTGTPGGGSWVDGPSAGTVTGGCLGLGIPEDFTHQAAFDALNLYREANGLPRLQYSVTLERAADADAKDMYVRNFFDHTNPDGLGPSDRAVAAGFCHPYVGENIAYGLNSMTDVNEVMIRWMNSPGHNENMLRPGFAYAGIGYYTMTDGLDRYTYWVQLFAFDE